MSGARWILLGLELTRDESVPTTPTGVHRLMGIVRCAVGDVELVRVGYADVTVPAERVGLTGEQIAAVAWAEPLWADGGDPRAGAAVWMIRAGDALLAVDPAQAADDILRQGPDAGAHQEAFAALLASAGVPRESVTHAIMTHAEGIGMWAWRNDEPEDAPLGARAAGERGWSWSPFFPNATILVSEAELAALDGHVHPSAERPFNDHPEFDALRAQGVVHAVPGTRAIGDRVEVVPGVSIEVVGGHTPGHSAVRIESRGERAVMLGHLTVSPLHLATGECPQQHPEPGLVETWLDGVRGEDALLIGPLWPEPGAGRWVNGEFQAVATR